MYVAVKGGEQAIDNAHRLLAKKRRGDLNVAEIAVEQIREQMSLAVDRVMTEGSLYDPDLAALALKQAMGDSVEAIFLLRAYRNTLPRWGYTAAIETENMQVQRRISATYKDIPGGQVLGPTFDYTHRLMDFTLLAEGDSSPQKKTDVVAEYDEEQAYPKVLEFLRQEGLLSKTNQLVESNITDVTREPLDYPTDRAGRLQMLTRADEGYLLALGYSTQRGYGRTHPFAGEIRYGQLELSIYIPELDMTVVIGEIAITECNMINQFTGNQYQPPQFTQGYGISFGFCERKTMAMALVDRSLQAKELGEAADVPSAQEEFVLSHCDNVESSGFVSHLKLPHYVDFQSELTLVRKMREEYFSRQEKKTARDTDKSSKSDCEDNREEING